MSKSINLSTVGTNDTISDLEVTSVSTDSTNTDKLARYFLDSKNSSIYTKTRIAVLRSKKSVLDQEILKFNDIYNQNREVNALELFNQMTLTHLTNLMAEFLDINQQIAALQGQLHSNFVHVESNLVN